MKPQFTKSPGLVGGNTGDIKDVLIIRPGAFGDAILTVPVLHALQCVCDGKLKILGTPASWAFLQPGQPRISLFDFGSNECLGLFHERAAVGSKLRQWLENVSTAIVYLSGETQTVEHALRSLGIREVVCGHPPRDAIKGERAKHAARQLLFALPRWAKIVPHGTTALTRHLLRKRHPLPEGEGLDLLAPMQYEINTARAILNDKNSRYLAMHPGSGGRRKCWPVDRFIEIAEFIFAREQLLPVVFFGPSDEEVRAEFQAVASPAVPWQFVTNKTLREVLALLSLCELYIGNDSGISHLAARACRALVLFGPTNPKVWSPIGRDVRIVTAPDNDIASLSVPMVLKRIKSR